MVPVIGFTGSKVVGIILQQLLYSKSACVQSNLWRHVERVTWTLSDPYGHAELENIFVNLLTKYSLFFSRKSIVLCRNRCEYFVFKKNKWLW